MLNDETLNFEGHSLFASRSLAVAVLEGMFQYEEAHRL